MMVLSIRQPWAYAILHLGKLIENRSWNTHFRGDFLIHASSSCKPYEMDSAIEEITRQLRDPVAAARLGGVKKILAKDLMEAPRGGIVGQACLVDVLPKTARPVEPWHQPLAFGFVLSNVRPLEFRPMKGHLGFFPEDR